MHFSTAHRCHCLRHLPPFLPCRRPSLRHRTAHRRKKRQTRCRRPSQQPCGRKIGECSAAAIAWSAPVQGHSTLHGSTLTSIGPWHIGRLTGCTSGPKLCSACGYPDWSVVGSCDCGHSTFRSDDSIFCVSARPGRLEPAKSPNRPHVYETTHGARWTKQSEGCEVRAPTGTIDGLGWMPCDVPLCGPPGRHHKPLPCSRSIHANATAAPRPWPPLQWT